MTVSEHIDALRKLMKERGYDIYIVPTDDFHQSENVGAYFQARTFITGFDGSAGTAIITLDHAGLWTDGRYFLQAEQQLSGTPVTLYRMLEPGVPSINEFLEKHLPEHGTIGFDGRVISMKNGKAYQEIAEKNYYRPRDAEVAKKYENAFPKLKLFTIDEEFGGWTKAQKEHFANGGTFDQISKR